MNRWGIAYLAGTTAWVMAAGGCFNPPEFTPTNQPDTSWEVSGDGSAADAAPGDAAPDLTVTDLGSELPGVDTVVDGLTDSAADVSPEVAEDAQADGVADAAADADAQPDTTDAQSDATTDAQSDAGPDAQPDGVVIPPAGGGTIAFSLLDKAEVLLVEAKPNGVVTNLTTALDENFGPSYNPADDELSISHNGEWLLLSAERLNTACNGWACLIRVKRDLSEAIVVNPGNGEPLHPAESSAISGDGATVAYTSTGSVSTQDIFITQYTGGTWTEPFNVTTDLSAYAFKYGPAFDKSAGTLVFNCDDKPYYDNGTAICQANATGDASVLLHPADNAMSGWNMNATLYHPYFAPDGTIVFTSDWLGYEQVFRYDPVGASAPSQVGTGAYDEGTACVLPDGRIASAWWNHSTNSAANVALKVSDADGTNTVVVWNGDEDIYFGSIGCGL